jgi:octaprenyl-diphosphate synthase
VAGLVGDYILSTALLRVAMTGSHTIVQIISELGRTLAAGEIQQLANIQNNEFSEEAYYQIIGNKTAALFEACAKLGAFSVGATEEEVAAAAKFGHNIGIIFQIRDDIFDYFDSKEIGKPTGNDMLEGKLTLPVIYALNHTDDEAMKELGRKVRKGTVTADEIAALVAFTKAQNGIVYAEQRMEQFAAEARGFIERYVHEEDVRQSLSAYVEYVVRRTY